jgi:tRNA threonylcarbamoyladenosine biosynthesis protein TsaB
MLVLVVDTAGSTGGVLLARNESASLDSSETTILGTGVLRPREFSTQLISSIAELFHVNRLTLSAVDAFAVISGPGSFTGLRVGLSAVKAMAEVMARPVIALSRLAIMASMAEVSCPGESVMDVVHAVLDAGRGEFYHGIYRDAGWTCVAESLQTLTALTVNLQNSPGVVVACESIVLDALSALPNPTARQIPCVSVDKAVPLVLAAWQARRFSDVALLDANYLRRMNPGIVPKTAIAPESADTRAIKS